MDVRPGSELPDYTGLRVEVDPVQADEAEVDERITALRQRFGTLKGVDRAAQDGDFVSIDLSATIDGEEVDSVNGVSYEVGTNNMLEGIDEALVGMTAGETKEFSAPWRAGTVRASRPTVSSPSSRSRSASCPSSTTTSPSWPRSSTPSTSCAPTS